MALDPTARPQLHPGTIVLRRDANSWQVGTCPGVVVEDSAGMRELLRLANGQRTITQLEKLLRDLRPDISTVIAELLARGVLILARPRQLGNAARARVMLHADSGAAPAADLARHLLGDAVRIVHGPVSPDLHLLLHVTEPPRDLVDDWMSRGEPFLPLIFDGSRARLGPFVVPGRTPCLSCYDLDRAVWEPSWPLIVSQLGTGEPVDLGVRRPILVRACSELAGEVLAAVDGGAPRATGAVVVIGPDPRRLRRYRFDADPRCTCLLLAA